MNSNDIAIKRSILLSVRMRFSIETQPIKEAAIDNIIEQNLLVSDCLEGLALEEIEKQGSICFACELPVISRIDMEKSLERLVRVKRVDEEKEKDLKRYKLSEQAKKELLIDQKSAESRFKRVVNSLFKDTDEGASFYEQAFLECLSIIFSRLGEAYVHHLKREIGIDDLLNLPSITQTLEEIKEKYTNINYLQFEKAIFSFFEDDNPDYISIKWNMAQNYYVAKALGLDPEGHLLSKEFFGNSEFYLDTNVLIDALTPIARHHQSFKIFSDACQSLKIRLKACQISLDELRRVVESRQDLIAKVADQIPEELAPKVHGIFYQMYREQKKSNGSVDLNTLFLSFNSPMKDLSKLYNVELVDDVWFIEAENQPETEKYIKVVEEAYLAKRDRPKRPKAALHDALLLRWIFLKRNRIGRKLWLITLDTSLPGFFPKEGNSEIRPIAITLPAILQWISPLAIHNDTENKIANVFSKAIKYQLLPQKKSFDLKDFLTFAVMESSVKLYPVEDVEKCIEHLRINFASLDPSDSEDREKLARITTKFFVDPGRKYHRNLLRLEADKKERDDEIKKLKRGISELEIPGIEHHKNLLRLKAEKEEGDVEIEKLKKEIARLEKEKKEKNLKNSANIRLVLWVLLSIGIEILAIYFAWKYGEGSNFIQRVKDLKILPGVGFVLSIILSWFIIGKERFRILGWPFKKLLNKK